MRYSIILAISALIYATVSAEQITVPPLDYRYHQITISGSLSYQIGSLNNDDGLGVYVAPAHCELFGYNNCGWYPSLTATGDDQGRFILETTYYSTNQTQLFLFVVNHNKFMSITVIYEYSNHGPFVSFFIRMFSAIFGQYGIGIALFIFISGGIVATIVYAIYVLCRGCWQTRCMTRKVPEDEEAFVYSVVGQKIQEREQLMEY